MNNSIGLIGISSVNANWNADFSGYPRKDVNGNFYATDVCLKYAYKRLFFDMGENVLGLTRFNKDRKVLTIEDSAAIFKEDGMDDMDVLKKCKDVALFGIVYAPKSEKNKKGKKSKKVDEALPSNVDDLQDNTQEKKESSSESIGSTGICHFSYGKNINRQTGVHADQIGSPFASDENKNNSTLGTKTVTDDARYVYSYTFNAKDTFMTGHGEECLSRNTKEIESLFDWFRLGSLMGATNLQSAVKAGCKNDFFLNITFNEKYKDVFPLNDLQNYVCFRDGVYEIILPDEIKKFSNGVELFAATGVNVSCKFECGELIEIKSGTSEIDRLLTILSK